MIENDTKTMQINQTKASWVFFALIAIGLATFVIGLTSSHPERAWQAYLINFLLWSAIAQGAVLFSAVMHMTNARWSGPLSGLSESFAAFFPISYILFLVLFCLLLFSMEYSGVFWVLLFFLFLSIHTISLPVMMLVIKK